MFKQASAGQFLQQKRFTQKDVCCLFFFCALLRPSSAYSEKQRWWFIKLLQSEAKSYGIQGANAIWFVHEEFRKTDKNASLPLAVMENVSAWKLYGVNIFPHFARAAKNATESIIIIVTTFQSSFRLAHYQITEFTWTSNQRMINLMTIIRCDLPFN